MLLRQIARVAELVEVGGGDNFVGGFVVGGADGHACQGLRTLATAEHQLPHAVDDFGLHVLGKELQERGAVLHRQVLQEGGQLRGGIPVIPVGIFGHDVLVGAKRSPVIARVFRPAAALCVVLIGIDRTDDAVQIDIKVIGIAYLLVSTVLSIYIYLLRGEDDDSLRADGGRARDGGIDVLHLVAVEVGGRERQRPPLRVAPVVQLQAVTVVAARLNGLYIARDDRSAGHAALNAVGFAQRIQGDGDSVWSYPVVGGLGDVAHCGFVFLFLAAKLAISRKTCGTAALGGRRFIAAYSTLMSEP